MENNILQLINNGENVETECKEAGQGLPKDMWETYSSFANTNGGVILLGIKQKGDTFHVSGVETSKRLKEFWDTINNSQKVSINLLNDDNIDTVDIEGKHVIKITVPRADRRQKPVYINQNPMIGTYRRNYEGDYRCSPEEVKSMLADQSDLPMDSKVLEHFGLNDINMDSVSNYRERFAAIKPTHPWIGLNNKDFLLNIGAWGIRRESGQEGLTVAGLLMFGNGKSITDQFPNYFLEYREKNSKDSVVRWDYRTTSADGTWTGNLYDFYLKIINKLIDSINIPFKLDGYTRKEDTRVHEAIREALANTLIHADYTGRQGVVIEKDPATFVFSNPGILRISLEQALKGGISDPRNPSIFKMFFLIGIGERAGSGLENIQLAWKEQNWRNPDLVEKFMPDRIDLVLRTLSLLPQESVEMLRGILRDTFAQLNRDEVMALVTAHLEEQITNSRLQILLEKNPSEIGKILAILVDKGLLVSDGQRRGMKYFLSDIFRGNDTQILGVNSVNNDPNSVNSEGNSVNSGDSSVNSEQCSIKIDDKMTKILEDISKEPREKKRIGDINKMKEITLKLCEVRPLTLKELAELLKRSSDGIRNNYLSPLIEEGKIRLMYPGQLNHPQQAYIAVKENE